MAGVFCLTTAILICSLLFTVVAEVYKDPETGSEYNLADLIFPSRPTIALRRMYPHVLYFDDLLHPVKRSYQFGFPEFLRGGVLSEVPSEIIFYTKPQISSGGSGGGPTGPPRDLQDWLQNRKSGGIEAIPFELAFRDLFGIGFDVLSSLIRKLGTERRTRLDQIKSEYLYNDHIREFLIGTWTSMYDDKLFHDEELTWPARLQTLLACKEKADIPCYWMRFLLIVFSSKINTRGSKEIRLPTVDDALYNLADTAAMSFWYNYCATLQLWGQRDDTTKRFCPNPCLKNPCADMSYTLNDNCKIAEQGLHEMDYTCTCIESALWSFIKLACVIFDRCKMNSPCSLTGTESCHFNLMTNEVKCICKSGYMGHDCNEPRDACFVRQETEFGSKPPGNRACNVESGSECIPLRGSNLFSCQCRNGWYMDSTWGTSMLHSTYCISGRGSQAVCGIDPNCQRRMDPCMSLPCENGDCVAGSGKALCQCPVTHTGPNCRERRGLWSVWGPWSSCDPDCGDRRVRHRSRACLGLDCLGHPLESAWCNGYVDCGVPEKLGAYQVNRWRSSIVLSQLLITMVIGIGVSMGILFACQCCLSVVLTCDRDLLDSVIRERSHGDQMQVYRRLSYKTALKLRR